MIKSSMGWKGFTSSYSLYSTIHGLRAGTWRQKMMQHSWKSVACWLGHHGLLIQPFYGTQSHLPKDVTTNSELSHSISQAQTEFLCIGLSYSQQLWSIVTTFLVPFSS